MLTQAHIDLLLSENPLSLDACFQSIKTAESGGICLFVGTTRNKNKGKKVTHLDFESYGPMALKEMDRIAERAFAKWNLHKCCMHHREGHVPIGEIAVIIGASSKHRDDAFQACRFMIDELKKSVPIWKKEFAEDGSYWVNATP